MKLAKMRYVSSFYLVPKVTGGLLFSLSILFLRVTGFANSYKNALRKSVSNSIIMKSNSQNDTATAPVSSSLSSKSETVTSIGATSRVGDCDSCSKIANTVKPYNHHLIICAGSYDWKIPRIEDDLSIKDFVDALANIEKVKISACDHPPLSSDDSVLSVIVYPKGRLYQIPKERFSDFSASLMSDDLASFTSEPLLWKRLFLVCAHMARDKRCGRAGPQVIAALREELAKNGIDEQEVAVRASSHLGGHEFAGTLIAYPQGEWYGQITKHNAKQLLSAVLSGQRLEECYRGKANLEW